jgi:hypothetical protein
MWQAYKNQHHTITEYGLAVPNCFKNTTFRSLKPRYKYRREVYNIKHVNISEV